MLPRLMVIAKAPLPGRSKTRLCPPCTAEQAASLAEAALADTLDAVSATECGGRTLVLDGAPGEWLPEGFDVVPQRGGGLAERLAAAFAAAGGPALLIGMDTPQVRPEALAGALRRLREPGVDAVLGAAPDGGYWAIGMREPRPDAFAGVPMSTASTGMRQRQRLRRLGLRVRELAELRDVDCWADAVAVAADQTAGARFADTLRAMEPSACPS